MNVFEFVNSINHSKVDLFEDPQAEKDYNTFIVNRALSYFPDTILYANEMNVQNTIPKEWQFDFLRHSIPKRKRFSKWNKKQTPDDLSVVIETYKYSVQKASEALSLLSSEQLQQLKQQMEKGGKS